MFNKICLINKSQSWSQVFIVLQCYTFILDVLFFQNILIFSIALCWEKNIKTINTRIFPDLWKLCFRLWSIWRFCDSEISIQVIKQDSLVFKQTWAGRGVNSQRANIFASSRSGGRAKGGRWVYGGDSKCSIRWPQNLIKALPPWLPTLITYRM